MSADNTVVAARKPLRLWPGIALAVIVLVLRFVVPVVVPSMGIVGVLGGLAGGVLILLWWLFFSRARWSERLGAVAIIAIAALATKFMVASVDRRRNDGHDVADLPAARHGRRGARGVGRDVGAMVGHGALGDDDGRDCCRLRRVGTGAHRRGEGRGRRAARLAMDTDGRRASACAERERDVAGPGPCAPAPAPVVPATDKAPAATTADKRVVPAEAAASAGAPAAADPDVMRVSWDGFRGPNRDGVVKGVRLATDWNASAPVEIWRRKVGPGWSSFAVTGDLIFTQEQRGEHELVSAHRLRDGAPVWRHQDRARFYESNGGAWSPRHTDGS